MTRKEAIKPEDIQVTYSRSPNLKDILIKGTLEDTHNQEALYHVEIPDVRHVTTYN